MALMHSQQLEMPAHDHHKIKPVNTSFSVERGGAHELPPLGETLLTADDC